MAHFTIDLPGNISADIRKGKVFKKSTGFVKRWPWIKISSEVRTGYFVMIEYTPNKIKKEYHLLKTNEGKWLSGTENELNPAIKVLGKWLPMADDLITLAIKKGIDDYENKQ
jgi:hypothetical protein